MCVKCWSHSGLTGSVFAEGSQLKMSDSCLVRHSELAWTNIGRESDGVTEDAVQQSLALRPPHHLASFLRLAPSCTKGITNSGLSTLVFLVLEGELSVVINNTLLTVRKGDNFYVPPETTYSLINLSEQRAELYLVQYKYVEIKNKQSNEL